MKHPSRALVPGVAVALLCGVLALAGCSKPDGSASATVAPLPGGLAPVASILDLMSESIDPLADELWEAVAIVSTMDGTVEQHPGSDEEWLELDRMAVALMEAANLLVVEGRPVAHPGQELGETDPETDLTPAQAQAEIDKDRPAFLAFAVMLQAAGGSLRDAIARRDVDDYLNAGSLLYDACEGCHRRFWYPDALTPEDFL